VGVGVATVGNSNITSYTLPLSYSIRSDSDPRRQLVLQLPITVVEVDGARSYQGGLGVGFNLPMNQQWTLTPNYRFSVMGSPDMATVSAMHSTSLTSTYVIPHGEMDIAVGNMLGYYKTAPIKAGSYSFDPNLQYIGARNGVMLSQPIASSLGKLSLEYSLIDTRYLGSERPYIDNFQEVGVTVGTNKRAFSSRTFLRAGITYQRGRDFHGITGNFGFWF
jgi:hypothetical protein